MNGLNDYISKFKIGTKTMFKEFFNKETNKKQRANMWTFSRLIMSFIIPILMILGGIFSSTALIGAAALTTAFAGITDILDGRSARKHKSFSEYGKLLDQVVDKIFSGIVGLRLSLFNPLFLVMLLGEGMIATTNLIYKKKYKDLNITSTMIGKVKQVPLCASLVAGFLSILIPGFPNITNITIIITLLFQLATTNSYIMQNSKAKDELKAKEIHDYINQLEEEEKNNEKVKVLEKSNGNVDISKKEQYTNLRNLLLEIKNNKTIEENQNIEGYQKRKTL